MATLDRSLSGTPALFRPKRKHTCMRFTEVGYAALELVARRAGLSIPDWVERTARRAAARIKEAE